MFAIPQCCKWHRPCSFYKTAVTRTVFISIVFLVSACSDAPDAVGPDAAPQEPEPQGSEATADLVINEISPRPGSGSDWIELYNRSGEPIDLCEFFVTDNLDRLDHYLPLGGAAPPDLCDPVMLEPGDYHVVFADDDPAAGFDHAPFSLGRADEVHVVLIVGLAVDSLIYLHPDGADGLSLARAPNGEGPFFVAGETQGAANSEDP